MSYLANRYGKLVGYWEIVNVVGLRVSPSRNRNDLKRTRTKILSTITRLKQRGDIRRYWRDKKVRITERAMRSLQS